MTTSTLRITVNAPEIPVLFRDAPRSVILPGLDKVQTYGRTQESPDWNIPSIVFQENVMPLVRGVVSVASSQVVSPGAYTNFDQAIVLRDKFENNTLLVPAGGANYLFNASLGTWAPSSPFTFNYKLITRAYTQGRTFIGYEKQKVLEYDGATGTLIDRTASLVFPAGFSMADIRGIGGASNYLLLFTEIDILWSAPDNPLNFNRLLSNGSGYQTPQDVRGQISCILPVAGGAIIYTVRNAVAALFTNNATTPFLFRGISNSGGVAGYEQVAYDADEQFQYVWGSGGLQAVTLQAAIGVFPEVADFLTSGYLELFNYTTNQVDYTQLGTQLAVKLTYISQRFLVISYGRSSGAFEFALIYDSAIKRWGKIRQDHVDCITFPYPNISGDLTYGQLNTPYYGYGETRYLDLGIGVISISPPKKSIAFLKNTGAMEIMVFDYSHKTAKGVVILGQLQHNRGNYTSLHGVELEGLDLEGDNHLYIQCSGDGKTVARVVEFLSYTPPKPTYSVFQGRETDLNFNLCIVGTFQLTGVIAKVSRHGKT